MTRRRTELTLRERQIAAMHAEGIPVRWIAALLGIHVTTVEQHLWRINRRDEVDAVCVT